MHSVRIRIEVSRLSIHFCERAGNITHDDINNAHSENAENILNSVSYESVTMYVFLTADGGAIIATLSGEGSQGQNVIYSSYPPQYISATTLDTD